MENKICKWVCFKNKLGNIHAIIVKITTTDIPTYLGIQAQKN